MTLHHSHHRYRSPAEIHAEQTAPQRRQQAKTAINNIQIPGCAIVGTQRASDIVHLFDTTYPNTLSGVISCDEFAASLERINIAGKVDWRPVYLCLVGLVLSICLFVVGIPLIFTTHQRLFIILPSVGMAGICFFCVTTVSFSGYQSNKSVYRQHAAIKAENDRYTSSERTIPCTWKLQNYRGTAQLFGYETFAQLEICSGAGFGSSIDVIAASHGFEAVDALGVPRNPQCGIFISGPLVVTANTALVPGQGLRYGAYGTMAPTAPLLIPVPETEADAPAMTTAADGIKAPLLPPSYGDSWQDSSASGSCPAPILLTQPAYKSMPATTDSSSSVTIPIANPSDSLVCAQCSKHAPSDSIFCSQCGARVGF